MIKVNLLKKRLITARQRIGESWLVLGERRFYLYGVLALIALIALNQLYLLFFVPVGRSTGIRPTPSTVEVAQRPEPIRQPQPAVEQPAKEAPLPPAAPAAPPAPVAPAAPPAPAASAPAPAIPPKVEPQIAPTTPQFQEVVIDGRGAKSHPWAVHIVSFRDQAQSNEEASELFQKGYMVYVSPDAAPNQEILYRVLMGRYKNYADALQASARFNKDNNTYTSLRRLPYAIEVAQTDSIASVSKEALSLKQKGYSPYFLQVDADSEGAQKFILLSGAFPRKERAEIYAEGLKKEGIPYRVITP